MNRDEFGFTGVKIKEQAEAGNRAVLSGLKPNMFLQFGAYPLIANAKVIGANGCSGADGKECVKAGWENTQKRLPQ
jgi:uncharacterized protein GlcG (DUF336 family)